MRAWAADKLIDGFYWCVSAFFDFLRLIKWWPEKEDEE